MSAREGGGLGRGFSVGGYKKALEPVLTLPRKPRSCDGSSPRDASSLGVMGGLGRPGMAPREGRLQPPLCRGTVLNRQEFCGEDRRCLSCTIQEGLLTSGPPLLPKQREITKALSKEVISERGHLTMLPPPRYSHTAWGKCRPGQDPGSSPKEMTVTSTCLCDPLGHT